MTLLVPLQGGPFLGGAQYPVFETFILLTALFFITAIYLGLNYNVEVPREPGREQRETDSTEVNR